MQRVRQRRRSRVLMQNFKKRKRKKSGISFTSGENLLLLFREKKASARTQSVHVSHTCFKLSNERWKQFQYISSLTLEENIPSHPIPWVHLTFLFCFRRDTFFTVRQSSAVKLILKGDHRGSASFTVLILLLFFHCCRSINLKFEFLSKQLRLERKKAFKVIDWITKKQKCQQLVLSSVISMQTKSGSCIFWFSKTNELI